jgi:hypothetical protein
MTYTNFGRGVLYVEVQSAVKWEEELEKLLLTMLKALNVMDLVYGMIVSHADVVMVRLFMEKREWRFCS